MVLHVRAAIAALSFSILATPLVEAAVVDRDTRATSSLDWSAIDIVLPAGVTVLRPFGQTRGGVGGTLDDATASPIIADPNPTPAGNWGDSRTGSFTPTGALEANFSFSEGALATEAGSNQGAATAIVTRLGLFEFSGSGTAQVTIPYALDVFAGTGGQASAFATLELSPIAGGEAVSDTPFLASTAGSQSEEGLLSVVFQFSDGEQFSLTGETIVEVAVVPLPAAAVLFGSALLLLRRRRRGATAQA